MAERVLMVGAYPIENAIGGGQMRARALRDRYLARGLEVRYCGVFYKGFYDSWSRDDIPVGPEGEEQIRHSPWTGDVICSEQLHRDPGMRRRFSSLVEAFRPDTVQIEQAFPYLGVRPILDELGMRPRLVFSSHNVEHTMKREILAGAGWDAKDVEALTGRIESLERDLAQRCDICIAVSDDDAQAHQAMGAGNVIVARNGASRRPSSAASERRWKARIAARGIRHTALFVGSAHPPNWVGFMSTVGTRLGFLAPDTCVLLAGGVADYMHEHFRGRTVDQVTMWRRLWPLGRVTDSDLAALLRVADVILLPITEGGGSNLKTAEAILSGRPVVATDYALRSFEDLMDLPNIHAARTPEEFRAAMLHAFSRPAGQRSAEQVRRSEAVLWERCLEGVAEAVASL